MHRSIRTARWIFMKGLLAGFRQKRHNGFKGVSFDIMANAPDEVNRGRTEMGLARKNAKVFLTGRTIALNNRLPDGGVAQLGERCVRNAEVVGSSPIASTI